MAEQCLTINQVARCFGVDPSTVYKHLDHLIAIKGLQRVPLSSRAVRFTQSSVEKIIKRAAERGEYVFPNVLSKRGQTPPENKPAA